MYIKMLLKRFGLEVRTEKPGINHAMSRQQSAVHKRNQPMQTGG